MMVNKMIKIAACAAIVIGAALSLRAAEVTEAVAKEAVAGWASLQEALTAKDRFAGAAVAKVETYSGRDGLGVFHVVSFEGGGFAVTSGDTEMTPILAYSEDGEFVANDENPLWVMLTRDVAGRAKRLGEDASAAKNAKVTAAQAGLANGASQAERTRVPSAQADEEDVEYGAEEDEAAAASQASQASQPSPNASAWARLRAAAAPRKQLLKAALPSVGSIAEPIYGSLCETKWNQYNENGLTCYNYYTPSNYLCGCVATAMAQIMRSFQWPLEKVELGGAVHTGRFIEWYAVGETEYVTNNLTWHIGGSYGETWEYGGPAFGGPYDWENMVAEPRPAAQAGTLAEVERQAIGLLCRDCGISVNMNYDLGGSGSDTGRIAARLVDTFGYKSAALRQNGNPISLTEQLDAYLPSFAIGSPCAVGIPGHAILADGYGLDSGGRPYVHYNYGWSSSAWYTPPDEAESDTEYPIVYKIVYNIMTPEAEYDAYGPGVCFVSGVVLGEDRETPVASAVVTAADGDSGEGISCTTDENGAFTLCLPPGYDYTLSAEKDGVTAGKKLGTVRCTAETVGNRRNVRLVLGIAAEDIPLELLHRWSFNGETDAERLADSGGSSATAATVCGTNATDCVTFADGRVSLAGHGNGSAYLSLGENVIPDTATLEIWAGEDAVRKWARVFDYGIDTANYVTLAWTAGTDQRLDRFSAFGENATGNLDGSMAPYTPGMLYHIAVTFEKDAIDGSTLVRIMRRDAKTGELQRMGSLTVANFTVSSIEDAILYLGHSQYVDDLDANATYDEVRVWRGVLSDAQLAANAVAGPDVADLDEAAQIASEADVSAEYKGGHTATRRGRIAFGNSRSGKGSTGIVWPTLALSDYTDEGVHDVEELNRASVNENSPTDLGWSQLRYDGWFEVTDDQAGWWTLNQKFDDYFLFAIDGDFAVFNHTYSSAATSRVRVTEGWHRFTVICGDTSGGYGALYEFGDKLVPFTISINGGDEMAFTSDNFTFGSDDGVVTLDEDTDWRELGAVTLSPGAVIDLNGHSLKVADISSDGIGAVVTNTADRAGRLILPEDVTVSGVAVAESGVKVWNGGALKWVQETAETTGLTGEWSPSVAYDGATGRAALSGDSVFEPFSASGGNVVTMNVTASFDAVPEEESTPEDGVQGAVWLGTNGCFQVWSKTGWVDVEAEGVTPQTGVEYTFRVKFDYRYGTYSASVLHNGTYLPLVQSVNPSIRQSVNRTHFPLAAPAKSLSAVEFLGEGAFTSLLGEWAQKANGTRIHLR